VALRIKRIYDAPDNHDGYRVLVDRLWPRGIAKEKAALDEWLKDVAPSPELRTWFHHEPDKFEDFTKLYNAELKKNSAVHNLVELNRHHKTVTLLYAAKDPQINHAKVLKDFIESVT